MVSSNPLFRGGLSFKKLNATVINDIWPEVMLFSAVAAMVAAITELTPHNIAISNQLIGVLGTVLGLVISFRTSSAYERYQDGRKMWTNIAVSSRNVAQMLWIHVPVDRVPKGNAPKMTALECVMEKKTMINLVQAFSVSVKHFLRGEAGVYYEDLYPLICFLPRYATPPTSRTDVDMLPLWEASEDGLHPYDHRPTPRKTASSGEITLVSRQNTSTSWFSRKQKVPFDPEKALPVVDVHRPLKPARNPPKATLYDFLPILLIFKPIVNLFKRKSKDDHDGRDSLGRKAKPQFSDSNVPLEITLYLSNYVGYLMQQGLLQPAIASGIVGNISTMQDTLANLDRIGNTPLPFAYQAHLRMSLWIYLLALPFEVVDAFGWLTIPGVAFSAFLLLGFLEIGQEIENPFNYDLNDLDLDHFCLTIQRELHEITASAASNPSEWIFNAWNQPLAPTDRRTAEDIVNGGEYMHPSFQGTQPGMDTVRKVLLRNWRDVDVVTRKN